ncbi:MAG: hypothetical protein ACYC0T_20695 [Ramlibacter sp.]
MIICDFPTFFHALWGYNPFPWQTMLAERAAPRRIWFVVGRTRHIGGGLFASVP